MERPIFKPVGTPVAQLDTPALVVDLACVEHNLTTFHGFFRDTAAKIRPHVTTHRCPALAHKQLAAGNTVGGICVSTVGEAEVFADQGFSDIFLRNDIRAYVETCKMLGSCDLRAALPTLKMPTAVTRTHVLEYVLLYGV